MAKVTIAEKIAGNLKWRLRLISIALGSRYIWDDLIKIADQHGFPITDICGNTEPFEFMARLLNGRPVSIDDLRFEEIGDYAPFCIWGLNNFNAEPSVSRFLGRLVANSGAMSVVELGTFTGWTSAHMALGLKLADKGGALTCVDINQECLDAARANLTRLGLEQRVSYVCGRSLDPEVLKAVPDQIDVIFLDTSHIYEDTVKEIETYFPRLRTAGLFVMHDSVNSPGVRRAVYEIRERFRTISFATERSNGVTILQRLH